jgi:hypothetical protein
VVRTFRPLPVGTRLFIFFELTSGADRRAVLLDAVSLKALVNEPIDHGAPELREGARPQLRVGKVTWSYETSTGSWRKR